LAFLWALTVLLYWQTYSYEAEFVQKLLLDNNKKKLPVSFNHRFRCFNDALSINNHIFHNYVHLIYPDELEMKNTKESDKSASYLDILLNIDSNGRLIISLYDKCDYFDFAIVNFPFLCSKHTAFTCLWCIYLSVDSICKYMFCVWGLFKTRQTTLKKNWCCNVIMNLV
jgi:hypothetical protein